MHAVRIAVAALLVVVIPAVVLAVAGVPPAPSDPVPIAAPIEQVGVDPGVSSAPLTVPRRAGGVEREVAVPASGTVPLPAARVWALLVVAMLGSLVLSMLSGVQGAGPTREVTPNG